MPPAPPILPPITGPEAAEVAEAGLAHLHRLILPDGRFIYAHHAGDITARIDGYNLLRHCGTLWFMARAMAELPDLPPATGLPQAMARGLAYVAARLEPAPWADPARPSLGLVTNGAVKLGGLGLALLALSAARRVPALGPLLPAAFPLGTTETIARMRAYALDEIEGEDFRHKRDIVTGAVLPFRSDYYTGEAIFGLLVTGPAPPELARVTAALMRRGYGWPQQSHWMAYAACEATERGVVAPDLGAAYLTGLMEAILKDADYRARRQSTPIACRTEALTRVLMLDRALPGLLPAGLVPRIRAHAAANLDIQLGWYQDGQFRKGDDAARVQIDYIQHNATAFLHWVHLDPPPMPQRGN